MDNIGPALSPTDDEDKSKKRSSDENDEERDSIYAKIALEYYNKENGTNYELDSAVLLSSEFISDGTWVHCNFAARKPNDKSSRMIFFAEMQGDDSPMTVTCCVVLEGNITAGCSFCSEVIHPIHGFLQGHHTSKKRRLSPVNKDGGDDDYDVVRDRRCAKIALEYYNKENGTNYELATAFASNDFISDGVWVHCNFTAKDRNMNGKSSRRLFFAEMHGDPFARSETTWTVTCCIVVEGGDITSGCSLCSDVIHPSYGFLQGHDKPMFSFHPTTSLQPTSNQPATYPPDLFQPTTFSYQQRPWYMPTPEELKPFEDELRRINYHYAPFAGPTGGMEPSVLLREHAEHALDIYNGENDANYEVFETLLCNDVLSNGCWYHINFKAKPDKEDTSPKLFFAEIYCGDNYGVTACHLLEEGETTDGCKWCKKGSHPTHGFSSEVRTYPPPVSEFKPISFLDLVTAKKG